MMGRKQILKQGYEFDYVYARGVFCYLVNNAKLKKYIKKGLNKRYRQENKNFIMEYNYD